MTGTVEMLGWLLLGLVPVTLVAWAVRGAARRTCRGCRHHEARTRAEIDEILTVRDGAFMPHYLGALVPDGVLARGAAWCRLWRAVIDPSDPCPHHSTRLLGRLDHEWALLREGRDPDDVIRARARAERAQRKDEARRRIEERIARGPEPKPPLDCDRCGRTHERCRSCRQDIYECGVCPKCGRNVEMIVPLRRWRCRTCGTVGDGVPDPMRWSGGRGVCEGCAESIREEAARKIKCPQCGSEPGKPCMYPVPANPPREGIAHEARALASPGVLP